MNSLWRWSVDHRELFWPAVWEFCGVHAQRRWDEVVVDGDKMPGAQWFVGAELNYAENLLRSRSDRPAIVFCNEGGEGGSLTFDEPYDDVARIAEWMRTVGVGRGDRVAALLPPIADLLVSAPQEGLLAGKQSGKLVGEEKVGKTACKRYTFSRETLDWEIWIGEDHLSRQFTIHYKDADDVKLTQTVTGLKWDLEAKFEDGTFDFKAPEGATEIKIVAPYELAGAAKKVEEK